MPIKIPSKRAKRWKGYRAMRTPGRKVQSKVEIYRTTQAGSPSNFMACVRVGTGQRSKRSGAPQKRTTPWQACANGKNPRRALGRAMAQLGRKISQRSGAFAGITSLRKGDRR